MYDTRFLEFFLCTRYHNLIVKFIAAETLGCLEVRIR